MQSRKQTTFSRPAIYIVAAMLLVFAFGFAPLARVTVRNDSAHDLANMTVSGRCLERRADRLGAGETTTFWFRPCGETAVTLSFHSDDQLHVSKAVGYVHGPPPSHNRVTVNHDLAVEGEIRPGWIGIVLP